MGKIQYSLKQWAIENDPSILKSWDYESNKSLNMDKIGYHSSKEVIWICEKGHHYPAKIEKRVIGHKCIYCTNRVLLKGYNDLESAYPKLAKEWDYEKNDKKPSEVKYSEKYVAHWICNCCGSRWQSSVSNRVYKGSGCNKCGKIKSIKHRMENRALKTGGFFNKYPEIASDWDYSLNADINPKLLNINDKRKFWWRCKEEKHSYEATINYRIRNNKCIYCNNKKVLRGFNDVCTRKKDLMDEWDFSKNIIKPEELVFNNSTIKVYWKCRYCKKEIISAPRYHNSEGCASCRTKIRHKNERLNKIKKGYNLDDIKYKNLKLDWDKEKNNLNNIQWEMLTPSYTKPVYWKCHICGYSWKTSMYRRTKEGTGCPACAHIKLCTGYNDLEKKYPELIEEWSPHNNIRPNQVLAGGNKKYLWICRYCNNEWMASIHNRVNEGSNCPTCNGFGTSFSEQAIFYYVKKIFCNAINRYVDSESRKELDIYIPNIKIGIEYDGYVFHKNKAIEDDNKTKFFADKGIKIIRVREQKRDNHLPDLTIYPFKCYEYDCTRKKYDGLNKIITEILKDLNVEHDFIVDTYLKRFDILHNMHQGFRRNSFGELNTKHLKYWDFEANKPLIPDEISKESTVEVNWKCDICGYKWKRSIRAELRTKGCPICSKAMVSEKYNLCTVHPEANESWNYEKNGGARPENIMPNTHKRYWWICSICGRDYLKSPPEWVKSKICQECGKESSRKKRCKKVAQYTIDGILIREFESAREAYKITGVNYKSISDVCRGGRKKQTGGYIWNFID